MRKRVDVRVLRVRLAASGEGENYTSLLLMLRVDVVDAVIVVGWCSKFDGAVGFHSGSSDVHSWCYK